MYTSENERYNLRFAPESASVEVLTSRAGQRYVRLTYQGPGEYRADLAFHVSTDGQRYYAGINASLIGLPDPPLHDPDELAARLRSHPLPDEVACSWRRWGKWGSWEIVSVNLPASVEWMGQLEGWQPEGRPN